MYITVFSRAVAAFDHRAKTIQPYLLWDALFSWLPTVAHVIFHNLRRVAVV